MQIGENSCYHNGVCTCLWHRKIIVSSNASKLQWNITKLMGKPLNVLWRYYNLYGEIPSRITYTLQCSKSFTSNSCGWKNCSVDTIALFIWPGRSGFLTGFRCFFMLTVIFWILKNWHPTQKMMILIIGVYKFGLEFFITGNFWKFLSTYVQTIPG